MVILFNAKTTLSCLTDNLQSFAHEVGHALGMEHDFSESQKQKTGIKMDFEGQSCSDKGGIMDYYTDQTKRVTLVKQWTRCSIKDFYLQYQNVKVVNYESKYCLEETPWTHGKWPALLIFLGYLC